MFGSTRLILHNIFLSQLIKHPQLSFPWLLPLTFLPAPKPLNLEANASAEPRGIIVLQCNREVGSLTGANNRIDLQQQSASGPLVTWSVKTKSPPKNIPKMNVTSSLGCLSNLQLGYWVALQLWARLALSHRDFYGTSLGPSRLLLTDGGNVLLLLSVGHRNDPPAQIR